MLQHHWIFASFLAARTYNRVPFMHSLHETSLCFLSAHNSCFLLSNSNCIFTHYFQFLPFPAFSVPRRSLLTASGHGRPLFSDSPRFARSLVLSNRREIRWNRETETDRHISCLSRSIATCSMTVSAPRGKGTQKWLAPKSRAKIVVNRGTFVAWFDFRRSLLRVFIRAEFSWIHKRDSHERHWGQTV